MSTEVMKTYVIDWGENCHGARYAIAQGRSKREVGIEVDAHIGEPARVALLELPLEGEGMRYMEIGPGMNLHLEFDDGTEARATMSTFFELFAGLMLPPAEKGAQQ